MDGQVLLDKFLSTAARASSLVGTGDPILDASIMAAGAAILCLLFLLLITRRKPSRPEPQPQHYPVGGRIEKLDMTLNQFRNDTLKTLELMRGDLGWLKREVIEIKNRMGTGLPDETSALEAERHTAPPHFVPIGQEVPPSLDFEEPETEKAPGAEEKKKEVTPPQAPELKALEIKPARIEVLRPAEVVPEKIEEKEEEKVESLASRLVKTRKSIFEKIKSVFTGGVKLDEEHLFELQALLVSSDLGIKTVEALMEEAKKEVLAGEAPDEEGFVELLRSKVQGILEKDAPVRAAVSPEKRNGNPLVVMIVGVNGSGKTTSTAKLAGAWSKAGAKVMMVAADTFRAAAVQQIEEWGRRLNVPVVSGPENAKPATVVFDAMEKAKGGEFDVILIDTAGRLHTKSNLMQELEGIKNIIARHQPDAPHEVLLVIDGTTGQNAVVQAREFNQATKLTGLVVTKLDGTPKGGVVVAIKNELGIPVRYIGVGEKPADLREFNAGEFVDALFRE